MAEHYKQFRAETPHLLDALRQEHVDQKSHARTSGILADLALGWKLFLQFAVEAEAITAGEAQDYAERARAGLLAMGQQQADHQEGAEPAAHFMRLIRSRGDRKGHVASVLGVAPPNAGAWGWRGETVSLGDTVNGDIREQGRRIGWLDGEQLYLDPEGSHAEVQKLAGDQNDSLSLSCQTLGSRLRERGYLTCIDQGPGSAGSPADMPRGTPGRLAVERKDFLGVSSAEKTVPSVPSGPASEETAVF